MKRSDLAIGMAGSAVLHLVFFSPWGWRARDPAPKKPDPAGALALALAATASPAEAPPDVKPAVPDSGEPPPDAPRVAPPVERPRPAPFQSVVERSDAPEKRAGETSNGRCEDLPPAMGGTSAVDDSGVPPLRLDVGDPSLVAAAARALGILVCVLDDEHQVRARLVLSSPDEFEVRPAGDISGFSNRIRLLPRREAFSNILQGVLERQPDLPSGARLALLVPAGLDSGWVAKQRSILKRSGRPASDVEMAGRFVRQANGSYELEIEIASP